MSNRRPASDETRSEPQSIPVTSTTENRKLAALIARIYPHKVQKGLRIQTAPQPLQWSVPSVVAHTPFPAVHTAAAEPRRRTPILEPAHLGPMVFFAQGSKADRFPFARGHIAIIQSANLKFAPYFTAPAEKAGCSTKP